MRKIKITGYGYGLPETTIQFGNQTRYRLENTKDYWNLVTKAAHTALDRAGTDIEEIDCIVAAMATPLQPIPCNAALIQEHLGRHLSMPAFDINSTCTSFITALDTVSYLIDARRYRKVLLVSGDIASAALNPKEKESYELFSDVSTAFVLESTEEDCGIVHSQLKTWSQGAHYTEIPKGGSVDSAFKINEKNKDCYYFKMEGQPTVYLTLEKLPGFLKDFLQQSGRKLENFSLVIPHQASRILPVIMKKLGILEGRYINLVKDYGNMVSGSIPFALCKALEGEQIKRGDDLLFIGTAAGLTMNLLIMRY